MDRAAEFQPEAVIRLLGRHGVRYVVIGGLAAITHGAPIVTRDIDLCYDRDPWNLERTARRGWTAASSVREGRIVR